MKRFLVCLCLIGCCCLTILAQKKREDLQLLVSPDVENIAIALIDNKPFLIKVSDVRLIDSKIMESISMYPAKSEDFKKVQNLYSGYTKNVKCVFDIKLKEGTCLPDEFCRKIIKGSQNEK